MRSTPIGSGLPNHAKLLFNRPFRVLLPKVNKEPINFNDYDEHYGGLNTCEDKYTKGNDTHKDSFSFSL